ncbi:MAG: hypothetical protein IJ597_01130 [Synergistaceae bacterium]|nr:hypothetical protein [Synergistaceae bacterium]
MTAKKYAALLIAILFLFMIINLAFWHGYMKDSFLAGDLSRLGSFKVNETLTQHKRFPALHVALANYLRSGKKESFDIITIGDSFSNGLAENYYQYILAGDHNLKILNVYLTSTNLLTDLKILEQLGLLDEISPKAIIYESVARGVQGRLGRKEIVPEILEREKIDGLIFRKFSKSKKALASGFFPPIMLQVNKKFLDDFLYRKEHPEKLSSEVFFAAELDRELFTNRNQESLLLFYFHDLNYLSNVANAAMINKNLNKAAEFLSQKNIKLIFMLCVDK